MDMSRYYNCSGGCIAGRCLAVLADGNSVRVDALRKGDLVRGPGGTAAAVRCVVRTRCAARLQEMVALPGGLLITPFHPVRAGGGWSFPKDLAPVGVYDTDGWVYTFVLDGASALTVNGTDVG